MKSFLMKLTEKICERIETLSKATKSKQITWERSKNSASCSCEYKGQLVIISKYLSNPFDDYFVLDGFDPADRNSTLRVFPEDTCFDLVKSFYKIIVKNVATSLVDY